MSYSPDRKYYFFWSGTFSQWEPCLFKIEGTTFNSAEQYMMYKKAILFNDQNAAGLILSSDDPKQQKAIGRLIKNYDDTIWESHREEIVYTGNEAKFSQNPKFMKKLLKTAPSLLVESSPVDTIWGVGLHKTDPLILEQKNWKGLNLLGKILTQLRSDFLQSQEYQ
ncbi:NADAR family protein [Marinomonas sp. THO17]|uniref:NADAR family protein n=1 Tax=Marinomonas sp. THO17 TaxID=3149048 RepID=UPI00336BB0C7